MKLPLVLQLTLITMQCVLNYSLIWENVQTRHEKQQIVPFVISFLLIFMYYVLDKNFPNDFDYSKIFH